MALTKCFIIAGTAKNLFVLTAESDTKYTGPTEKSNRSIFGDGAAACLISTEGIAEIGEFNLGTDGSGYDKLIVKTGGSRYPEKLHESLIDEQGHVNYSDYLYMDGGAIFNFTLEKVPEITKEVMSKNDLGKEQIDYYVFHQANKFMLNTIDRKSVV